MANVYLACYIEIIVLLHRPPPLQADISGIHTWSCHSLWSEHVHWKKRQTTISWIEWCQWLNKHFTTQNANLYQGIPLLVRSALSRSSTFPSLFCAVNVQFLSPTSTCTFWEHLSLNSFSHRLKYKWQENLTFSLMRINCLISQNINIQATRTTPPTWKQRKAIHLKFVNNWTQNY